MTIKSIFIPLAIALGAVGAYLFMHNQTPQTPKAGGLGQIISGPTTSTFATVLTTNTLVLATSSSRQYAAIVNDGANPVYLSIYSGAVADSGILLVANGGSYEINDQNLFTAAVYGIASSSSSNVSVLYK
jgi:hypothetical protein